MNGIGWLMEVAWPGEARQRWVARVGDRTSEPLPLGQAKAAAKTLLTTKGKAEPRERFRELNQIATNEIDQAYWTREKRTWPLDLIGAQRHAEVVTTNDRDRSSPPPNTSTISKMMIGSVGAVRKLRLMKHAEQPQQNDDRYRDTDQPQQYSAHGPCLAF